MARVVRTVMQNEGVGKAGQEDEANAEHGRNQRRLERLGARGGNGSHVESGGMRIHQTPSPPHRRLWPHNRRQVSWLALHRRAPPSRTLREISGFGTRLRRRQLRGSCALRRTGRSHSLLASLREDRRRAAACNTRPARSTRLPESLIFPAEAVFDYGELSVLHPCKA